MITLNNKISIITGASSGIGRATAILFASLGSKMILVGRDTNALDETIKLCKISSENQARKVVGDLRNPSVSKKIVDECIKNYGKLSILVNNAAIFKYSDIKNTKLEEFDDVMNCNLRSVFVLTQLCVPHLIKEKGSAIVNVSSVAGTRSIPGILPYSLSKAALDQFTKCTALELAEHGIRVNGVNPGTIITNIHRRAGHNEEQYKQFLEHCKSIHALGRPGNADEVANIIAFLASDQASFITGELVHVDGGRHRMSPK